MGTVGELVTEAWPKDKWYKHVKSTLSDDTAAVASTVCRVWETVFRDLGIWDAEVLEGVVGEASNGLLSIWPADYAEKPWWDAGITPDKRVRIIVLPCSQKENDCSGKEDEQDG